MTNSHEQRRGEMSQILELANKAFQKPVVNVKKTIEKKRGKADQRVENLKEN